MNIDTYKALLLVAGKKDVRYYLNGIFVDHVKRVAVATNGYMLIACKLSPDDIVNASVIIPREAVENAVKIKNASLVIEADSRIKLAGIESKPVDGRYPDWLRAVPESASGEYACFDFEQLYTLNNAGKLITGKKSFNMRLQMNGQAAALAALGPDALGVIMPCRPEKVFDSNESEWLPAMQAVIRA